MTESLYLLSMGLNGKKCLNQVVFKFYRVVYEKRII